MAERVKILVNIITFPLEFSKLVETKIRIPLWLSTEVEEIIKKVINGGV